MTSGRSGNKVELVDGIICYTQVGDQTREVAIRTVQALLFLTSEMKEIKILADYSQSGAIGEDTIQNGLYAMKNIAFDKVAVFGASEYLKKLVRSMAQSAGMSDIIHFVSSREEGFEWLKQPATQTSKQ